jgi:hypothetical protein
MFTGSYIVGSSPDTEAGTTTTTGMAAMARGDSHRRVSDSATSTTRIHWGDEGCSPTFWNAHSDYWDGRGVTDVTTTIQSDAYFNATFGVTAAQSGISDDLTLHDATALEGTGKAALARYAAMAIANADAGIAFRYRVGDVMSLYRDAVGADSGPETIASVLAKPSATESFRCPDDLGTRRLASGEGGASGTGAAAAQRTTDSATEAVETAAEEHAGSARTFGDTELSVLLGALQLFGLGGLGYWYRHGKKLRRAARWR